MMLSLMYHHANKDLYSNDISLLKRHFKFLSDNYKTIFPDEYVPSYVGAIKVCLVFDDGYFDFYHHIFPLLVENNIKALLSIVPKYILDNTNLADDKRLSLKHSDMMKSDNFIKYAPFCTWKEIREMVYSGYVQIASHGVNHVSLTELDKSGIDYELEVSKEIIESKLACKCNSFVYPYGCFNDVIRSHLRVLYKYDFAIGGAFHYSLIYKTIYRVYADDMMKYDELFTFRRKLKYFLRWVCIEFERLWTVCA